MGNKVKKTFLFTSLKDNLERILNLITITNATEIDIQMYRSSSIREKSVCGLFNSLFTNWLASMSESPIGYECI